MVTEGVKKLLFFTCHFQNLFQAIKNKISKNSFNEYQ